MVQKKEHNAWSIAEVLLTAFLVSYRPGSGSRSTTVYGAANTAAASFNYLTSTVHSSLVLV